MVLDEIRLQGPRLAVARLDDGKYDISDLLDEWLKPSEPSPTPRFSINNIQIIGGKVVFEDQPAGKVHTVSDINLGLPFISSLPYQAKIVVEPSFSALFDGSPLVLKGKSTEIFEGHLESELNLDLDKLDLSGFQPYLPSAVPIRLKSGLLDTELRFVFKELSDKVFSLTVVGSAHVSDFDMDAANGAPLLAWKRLDVDVENGDLINRRFVVKRVLLDGMDAFVAVNKAGEVNWLQLGEQIAKESAGEDAAPAAPVAPAAPAAKPPEWSVEEIRLSNGKMHWQDESNEKPMQGEVLDLNVVVGKIESSLASPIEVAEVSYRVDLGERLTVARSTLKGIRVDLHGHRIDVAEASTHKLKLLLVRNKEGKLEWVSSPVLKTARKAREDLSDERPWFVNLAKLNVDDLALRVEDQLTSPVAIQTIDGFNLAAENLSNRT